MILFVFLNKPTKDLVRFRCLCTAERFDQFICFFWGKIPVILIDPYSYCKLVRICFRMELGGVNIVFYPEHLFFTFYNQAVFFLALTMGYLLAFYTDKDGLMVVFIVAFMIYQFIALISSD